MAHWKLPSHDVHVIDVVPLVVGLEPDVPGVAELPPALVVGPEVPPTRTLHAARTAASTATSAADWRIEGRVTGETVPPTRSRDAAVRSRGPARTPAPGRAARGAAVEQSTPPESWLVGVTAAGDQLASLRVHAGYLAAGPASGRPHRVHVRFRLHDPSPSGFPGAGEALDLNVAEERVVAAVRPVAVLVAVVTAPGFRDLVLHTDDPTRVALEVGDDLMADLGYEPTVDVDEDPAWSTYRSLFADAVVADGDRRVRGAAR